MNPRRLAVWLLLVSSAGCDDKDTKFWQSRNQLLPAVALDDRPAFVEVNAHTAYLVDPGDPDLKPRMVPVGEAPVLAVKHNGKNELLVLSRGNPGSAAKAPVPAQLQVIDAAQGAVVASFALTSRFDRLAQSDDGRFAILFHASAKGNASDSAFYNPNELTIIDFAQTTPFPRSIRSLGGAPDSITFSPSLNFRGAGRTLAVVLAQNYVTLLDLTNPSRTEISVPLCTQTTGCSYNPRQVVFGPNPTPAPDPVTDQNTPRIFNVFVGADNAKDIFQITLTELSRGEVPPVGGNDFRATMALLAVGSRVADMAVFLAPGSGVPHPDVDTRLLVAAPDALSLLVIDPKTTNTTTVPTRMPVDTLIPFATPPSVTVDKALLVDKTRGTLTASIADLSTIETAGSAALAHLALQAAVTDVEFLPNDNLVVLVYGKSTGGTALAVVDLTRKSVAPMSPNTSVTSLTFDTHSPSRIWSAVPGAKLGYLNLVARPNEPFLYVGTVWLDQAVTSILPLALPSSLDGHRHLVLGHNDSANIGNITVLDADNPDRATARTAYGFLLSNYLERGQP